MGRPGLLERRTRAARVSEPDRRRRSDRRILNARRALALVAVMLGTLAGGLIGLSTFYQDKHLSVGTVSLSVEPFHPGALDLYVPLVDWGVRFDAVRLPARLHADLRTVDRSAVERVAQAGTLDLTTLRAEARDAIASYLKLLIGVVVVCAALLGLLVASAVRGSAGPRLRWRAGTAAGTAAGIAVALVVLLPPRGSLDSPQYYAFGPDIPRALQAVEAVQRSSHNLDQELEAQLVGLARLVRDPGRRTTLAGRPTVTVASDLHNNVLALPTLERAAGSGPVLFPGDITDRGTPLETRLVRRIARIGHPFVFVSGNHDSDTLATELAGDGAIVLTQYGQLMPDGSTGHVIVKAAGLRIAGYSDPFQRLSRQGFRDRYDNAPTPAMQDAFTAWLRPLIGKVDVVMAHEPDLIAPALALLRDKPPPRPLVFVVGHTHQAAVEHFPGVSLINGGSVGAGGTGNLAEKTPIGLARFIYTARPAFQPLAADLVTIDPGTGSATARRQRLD